MKPIKAPLKPNDRNPEVANLHGALLLLIDREAIRTEELDDASLIERLRSDRERENYTYNTTYLVVQLFQKQHALEVTGEVDRGTAAKLNDLLGGLGVFEDLDSWTLQGRVTHAGKPKTGIRVEAYDRDLRKRQLLGYALTDSDGKYHIEYFRADFAHGDRKDRPTPWLVVEATPTDDGPKVVVQKSRDVQREETINLVFEAPQLSECERNAEEIESLLVGQGDRGEDLTIEQLTDDDVKFIVNETSIPAEQVVALINATKAAKAPANRTRSEVLTHRPSSDRLSIPVEAFYAWFRQGYPTELGVLWAMRSDTLMTTLKAAIAQRFVSSSLSAHLDNIKGQIEYFQLDRVLQEPAPGTTAKLGSLLATLPSPLTPDQQRALAAAVTDLRPDDPHLVKRIAEVSGLNGNDAAGVARVLRLDAFTEGHLPLIQTLQLRLLHAEESEGSLRPLAALQPDEWLDLTYTHGTPEGWAITPVAYADALAGSVEQQYPTAALEANFMEGRRLAQLPRLANVDRFLRQNPTFDIVTANLNMLKEEAELRDIPQPGQLLDGLWALQRMKFLGASWDETATLLQNDLYLPHQILAAGPTQLVSLLEGQLTPERVAALYERAAELHNVTIGAVTAAFSPLSGPQILPDQFRIWQGGYFIDPDDLNGAGPQIPPGSGVIPDTDGSNGSFELKELSDIVASRGLVSDPSRYKIPLARPARITPDNKPQPDLGRVINQQPTLQALFGPQDACACGHCNSVLSPAAYFVDLLQFIKNADISGNLQLRLLARRPDLLDLELSCNNTNTEVPAIDLAVEILENAIALPLDVELPAGADVEAQLRTASVGEDVKAALRKTVRKFSGELRATPEAGDWTVVDGHRRWKLTAQKEDAFKAELERGQKHQLDTQGLNLPTLIEGLDQRRIVSGAEPAFARLFAANRQDPPDFANYEVTITPLTAGHLWSVGYKFVVQLLVTRQRIVLESTGGRIWSENSYDEKTISAVDAELAQNKVPELVKRLIRNQFSGTSNFVFQSAGRNRWKITSVELKLTLHFTRARLTITSLAYQSGDPNVDAIAWPENHNPEAYVQLKAKTFPWSLPVDLPLVEVRLFLERARSSRRKLMELMAPIDQLLRDDTGFTIEVLGLSAAEAKLIAPDLPSSDNEVFAKWGVPSGTITIIDTAAAETVTGEGPLELLKNVSILLQQSRLTFEELQALFTTRFLSQGGTAPLSIEPLTTCKPSEMTIPSLTPGHLDRINRIVRLQRRLGWAVQDLDKAIQIITGTVLVGKTLQGLADLVRLGDLLHIPSATIVGWWNGSYTATDKLRLLASALTLTTDELEHSLALLDIADPFVSVGKALEVCERVVGLQRGGITFEGLRYLLQHKETPGSNVYLDKRQLTKQAGKVRDAVRLITVPPERIPALPPTHPESIATALAIRVAREDAAITALATGFGAARELIDEFLRTRLRHPSNSTKRAIDVFLEASFLVGAVPQPNSEEQTEILPTKPSDVAESVLLQLYKSVYICNALKINRPQLQLLRMFPAGNTGMTALDFNVLPTAPITAPANVLGFEQLVALVALGSVNRTTDLLHNYAKLDFANPSIAQKVHEVLEVGLAIDSDEVNKAAQRLHITTTDQYRDPKIITRLIGLLTALKQLGTAVEQVNPEAAPLADAPQGLIASSPNEQDADIARELLHRKYGESQWHDLIKPIADKLRERKRAVLLDHLIYRDKLRDANDLYEYYLIDVQTGTCLKTTRLLLATAAVQLYVQRVLLNLEGNASLGEEKRSLWEWMGRYRVWEANRKVFLFPENWLLPELRDDKSSIFRQLESGMTQHESSQDVAREAVLGYLDDFAELANISVIAMYEDRRVLDPEESPEFTLYVIGRTQNQPYRYFFRSCSRFATREMSWSGWEALELDNANDFILPFILQGDLHVAWPIFRKTKDEQPEGQLLWEVQIAWIRRTKQTWSKRKLSHDFLPVKRLFAVSELRSFVFKLGKEWHPISSPLTLGLEKVFIYCYSAEALEDNQSPHDAQLEKNGLKPSFAGEKPTNWVNVFLSVSGRVSEHYEIQSGNDKVDRYQPAANALVILEFDFGYYAGGKDVLRRSTTTDNSGDFSFGEISARNQGHVTLTFFRRDSGKSHSVFTDLVQIVGNGDKIEWKFWTWNLSHVFEIKPPPKTPLDPDRPVTIINGAGSFVFESTRDMQILKHLNGPELNQLPLGMNRLGNRFVWNSGGNYINLLGNGRLKVDHELGGNTVITPAITETTTRIPDGPGLWHVSEQNGSYYYYDRDRASGISILPDGHEFVGWYRTIAVTSTFTLFDPGTQAMLRDGDQTLLPPPSTGIHTALPNISFDRTTPYANYNWELFLHVPLSIAAEFAHQQRFADARRWLHVVLNPTTAEKIKEVPQFWRFLPFQNDTQPDGIAKLLTWLADPSSGDLEGERKVSSQIGQWKKNPFMPHLIARLRPSAYQWHTFFAYLDVLIGWGDQLFRRDTRESVNEATLLYVLAAKLLGPRQRTISAPTPPPPLTYRLLQTSDNGIDDFSNAWVNYSDLPGVKKLAQSEQKSVRSLQRTFDGKAAIGIVEQTPSRSDPQILTSLSSLAFCVPQNDRITHYYELLENRLFNVRHCRNIDGVVRDLPLYDPPIDPLLLIRARAAGLDIDSVLADFSSPISNYRFSFTLQAALDLCAELKALGGALLAALEKMDGEELILLRSRHEIDMLKLVRETRQKQVDESDANIVALQQSEKAILERFSQYQKLLGKTSITKGQGDLPIIEQSSSLAVSTDQGGGVSGLGLVRKEIDQIDWMAVSNMHTQVANTTHIVAGLLSGIPNFSVGFGGLWSISFGGSNLGSAASAVAKGIEMAAVNANYFANSAGTFGGYERRQDEWVHQSKLALAELKQIQKQILAAEIRKEIAKHELSCHDKQIENATEVDEFMRSKFTSQQLYRWMSSQIQDVYFRTYEMACDLAKKAERDYRFELGLEDSNFIQPAYWDSLKKGLLAGEKLHHDLKRMESAYREQNRREFEITKHVSLLQLNPIAFIQLKETGACEFDLPEALFDLDYPGHYMRRVKMVSLSIPCVVGPYASVSATLELTKHETRIKSSDGAYKRLPEPEDDPRFMEKNAAAITAIVTSSAQQDSGMFDPNLRDERYLPFEGVGAISSWKLTLPDKFRPFDYETISDVVLHIRYTARDGGADLKTSCQEDLDDALKALKLESDKTGLARLFSLRHEFPTEWHRFLHPPMDYAGDQILTIPLEKERFSFLFRDTTITLSAIELFVKVRVEFADSYDESTLRLSLQAGTISSMTALPLNPWNGLLRAEKSPGGSLGNWTLTAWLDGDPHLRLDPNAIQDIFLVCRYTCSSA